MKRILVGIDGSDASIRAAQFAAEIAERFSARLTLVTVVPAMLLPGEAHSTHPRAAEEDEHRGQGERILHDAVARLAAKLEIERVLVTGSPAEALAEIALASDVGLVVVGRRGRSAVDRVLLGSVSDRLVRTCQKPVLIVH